MRYFSLALLVASVIALCLWQQGNVREVLPVNKELEWNDSLMKCLPKGMDTSIIVKDANGIPLQFHQYIKPVFNNDAMLYQDRGQWRMQRLTEAAHDSLKKDDHAIARVQRSEAYRNKDTATSAKVKLANIAHTLDQADYVLILKQKRKMIVTRKGIEVLCFNINLGWSPVGNKEFDGDGKTPEGIYHLDNKYIREDNFHKSFWISYPNINDKEIAKRKGMKPGVGILIHGTTPKKISAKDWTAGCIALQNKDIDELFAHVASGTLIEIRK